MREFSNYKTYGNGMTRRKDGSTITNVVVAQTLDVFKESVQGDFLHATPFRHMKIVAEGRLQQYRESWYDSTKGGISHRVYEFQSDYSAPMVPSTSNLPYLAIGEERYARAMWITTPADMKAIADNRCLEDCKQAKFTLGETLVELCETVSFATTKTAHFLRVLVDLRHGRFSNALKQLGIRKSYLSRPMSERWLEAQFAIRPLIGEIEQARQLAKNKAYDTWHTIGARGTARKSEYLTTSTTKTEVKSRLTTDAKWKINDTELRFLMQLGMANPAELLWEFLPLTWLVDYVVGIGDWVGQLLAPIGCTHVTTSRSMKVKGVQWYAVVQTIEQTSTRVRTKQTANGVVQFEGIQRKPDIFAPVPTLQYKLPLNVNQLANIAALTEIFTRGLRK